MNTNHSPAQPLDPLLLAPFEGCQLVGVRRLGHCIDLPSLTLLHAGPPYRDQSEIPLPVMYSAVQSMLHHGIATDATEAQRFLRDGTVAFKSAQDHQVVTPLAQTMGRLSWVFVVTDGRHTHYAPCVEGPAPALRFGSADANCLRKLAEIESWLPDLDQHLGQHPVDMQRIIEAGLLGGDECHVMTRASQTAFAEALLGHGKTSASEPWFVLPVLMGTCAVALARAGTWHSMGSNGVEFGYKWHGENKWERLTAPVLSGLRDEPIPKTALPAIGDSAVIDFAGLGAQALHMSPDMQTIWQQYLPDRSWPDRRALIDPATGVVCPRQAKSHGKSPSIHLAMVDSAGSGQSLGLGVCEVVLSDRLAMVIR